MWGFTDRYTWIDGFFGEGFAPLPLDESYQRKPAYFGLRDGLLSTTHPVAGKRFLARNDDRKPARNRVKVLAKAGTVDAAGPGSLGDPTVHGGVLTLVMATTEQVWELPAEGWTALGRGRGYRYADRAGTVGPVRTVVVKDGRLLKVVGRGDGLELPLEVDPAPVVVSLATGITSHCMTFEVMQTLRLGRKLRATKAPAPPSCTAPVLVPG
jgi:hypothetical protein